MLGITLFKLVFTYIYPYSPQFTDIYRVFTYFHSFLHIFPYFPYFPLFSLYDTLYSNGFTYVICGVRCALLGLSVMRMLRTSD